MTHRSLCSDSPNMQSVARYVLIALALKVYPLEIDQSCKIRVVAQTVSLMNVGELEGGAACRRLDKIHSCVVARRSVILLLVVGRHTVLYPVAVMNGQLLWNGGVPEVVVVERKRIGGGFRAT